MKIHQLLLARGILWVLLFQACGTVSEPTSGGAPPEAPTTGNKWVEDGVDASGAACFVLADEECGGTDESDYLDYFEASLFRSGYAAGDLLYAIDGANLWVIDGSQPTRPERRHIVAGIGRALAITGRSKHLYVASGDRGVGIFEIDFTQPAHVRRVASVPLQGTALDVALEPDGSALHVALGNRGLATVPLAADGLPAGEASPVEVSGFVNGVTVHGEHLFVAACSGLSIVNAKEKSVIGKLALKGAEGQAPMPIKDVAVADGVAALAAGRWGMVFVDVSNPAAPVRLGNRTERDDLLYYGNGVTAANGHFYLAAGDWGVDRVALAALKTKPPSTVVPARFGRYCGSAENPDRKPAPELETTLPPPRTQDPLDVVPVGNVLYAMGDASRLGVRAVDVYELGKTGAHSLVGRYEEPGLVDAIAAGGGKVALAGKRAGLFTPVGSAPWLSRVGALPAAQRDARVVALDAQGGLLSLDRDGALRVEGAEGELAKGRAPTLAVSDQRIATLRQEGVAEVHQLRGGSLELARTAQVPTFTHGATQSFLGSALFVVSPTWTNAVRIALGASFPTAEPLAGAYEKRELENPKSWRGGAPSRLLVPHGQSMIEVASFGGRARALVHAMDGSQAKTFELPAGRYVAGFSQGKRLVLVQGDRATYRTSVLTVALAENGSPALVDAQAFVGAAIGAAQFEDKLYVADREVGVRVFELQGGQPLHRGVAGLEVAP